jgi:hypothetical protein
MKTAATRRGTGGPPGLGGTPRILICTRIKPSKSEASFSIDATKRCALAFVGRVRPTGMSTCLTGGPPVPRRCNPPNLSRTLPLNHKVAMVSLEFEF